MGVSLASPTTNFYLGLSTELLRNVELVYGASLMRVSDLAVSDLTIVTQMGAPPTPPTKQAYEHGYFVGLTFNVSGFVQGLFGGGGASSGSKGSGS